MKKTLTAFCVSVLGLCVAFGAAGKNFVRASYAASMKQLSEAVRRIQAFIGEKG